MFRSKLFFVLVFLLSGLGLVSAQDDALNFTVIRDSDSFTIYKAEGVPFSLDGLSIEVFTTAGDLVTFPLDEYPAFALLSRPIPTELCVRVIRTGTEPPIAEQCEGVSSQFTLVQEVPDADVFWYDADADALLTFSLLSNEEFVGFCQEEICEFSVGMAEADDGDTEVAQEPTSAPTATPTNLPSATSTPTQVQPTATPTAETEPTKAPLATEEGENGEAGGTTPRDFPGGGNNNNDEATSEWGVSGRVLSIESYQSEDWEDIVDELEDVGLIPNGSLVFNERGDVFRAGTGFLTVPLARTSEHQNVVMGGTLTFSVGDTDELEYCTLDTRMVIQNNSIVEVARVGLLSNEGETGLVYLDDSGTADDDFYSVGVSAELDFSETYHILVIADDDTMTAYINGQLAFEEEPMEGRFGVYGLTLLGTASGSRCDGENIWVYQFD